MAKRRRKCPGLKGKGKLKKGWKWIKSSSCPVRAKGSR